MITAPVPLPSPETRALFLDALREKGTMLSACRAAGATRADVRDWIASDPAFEQDLEDALADFRDSLQERLLLAVEDGRSTAGLRFLLRAEIPEKYGPRPILGIKPWYDDDKVPGPPESRHVVTQFFGYLNDAILAGGAHVAPLPSRGAPPPQPPTPAHPEIITRSSGSLGPDPSLLSSPSPFEERGPGDEVSLESGDESDDEPGDSSESPSLCVGWRDGDSLFLDPTAAAMAADAMGKATGWPLMVPPSAIGHCLQECGLLLSAEQDSEHLTVRRYIDGVRRRVLHVPAKYLESPVPPVPSPSPNLLDTPPCASLAPVPSVPSTSLPLAAPAIHPP